MEEEKHVQHLLDYRRHRGDPCDLVFYRAALIGQAIVKKPGCENVDPEKSRL
jgi:hypothetical protein